MKQPHSCPVCRCGMWRPDIHPTRWDEMVWNNQRLAKEVNELKKLLHERDKK